MVCVFILLCANGEYYVSSTTYLQVRLQEHISSETSLLRGAKFTKAHQPVKLVYVEEH